MKPRVGVGDRFRHDIHFSIAGEQIAVRAEAFDALVLVAVMASTHDLKTTTAIMFTPGE
jgi:hypothetical protein